MHRTGHGTHRARCHAWFLDSTRGLKASPLATGEAPRVVLPPTVAPAHDRETHGAQAQLPPD